MMTTIEYKKSASDISENERANQSRINMRARENKRTIYEINEMRQKNEHAREIFSNAMSTTIKNTF